MNIAVVLAGGTGQRMGSNVPKQFVDVNGKPVIVHTLEVFENHPLIDAIIVVCIKSWMDRARTMLEKFGIQKVVRIVEGGDCVQQSTYNGLRAANEWVSDKADKDYLVVVHDSVRPMIGNSLITANIENALKYGNSITVAAPTDTFIIEENGKHRLCSRKQIHIVRAPQVFRLNNILQLHEQAIADGKQGYSDCCSLLCEYGIPFHETMGDNTNIKITYPEDMMMFKRLKG